MENQPFATLNNGQKIPMIGFGTYPLKGEELQNLIKTAVLEVGYRHIDTASIYGNEEDVGLAL